MTMTMDANTAEVIKLALGAACFIAYFYLMSR